MPDPTVPLRVLVVEDSEDDAWLLLRELRKGGFAPTFERVQSLADVTAALAGGDWELILSDYNLPGFNALDVLRTVREAKCDLPVIIVSGAIGEDLAVETMHAGAHDYIMKDNLTRLNPAVRRELGEMEVHRQRQAAETALRETEEHFRQLAGNVGGVLWLVDCTRAQMLYVNAAYEQVWECDPDPLFESLDNFLASIDPEDFGRIQGLLETHGWTGFSAEYRIQRPDGSVRWISTHSFPIHDAQGQLYRCAGLSTDITEHKELEFERRKLSRALEQTADAVMITDSRGHIEYVNPAFETVTGFRCDEVVGRRPSFLSSGLHGRPFFARLWKTLLGGLPFSDIIINRRRNGDLYYQATTITPVRDERGDVTHFVTTGMDITENLREGSQRHLSLHDEVTGLPNRTLFVDRLRQGVAGARLQQGAVALLCVDFDLSDLVAGEKAESLERVLLGRIATRLERVNREGDLLARIGDSAFAILRDPAGQGGAIREAAQALLDAFTTPVRSDGYELYLVPRVGISRFPEDGDTADLLLSRALIAMRHARRMGEENLCFYQSDMRPESESRSNGPRLSS